MNNVMTRWFCSECGGNSPSIINHCLKCQEPRAKSRNEYRALTTAIMSQGNENVVNNVQNVHVREVQIYSPPEDSWPNQPNNSVQPMYIQQQPQRDHWTSRFFIFTGTIFIWLGILTIVLILAFFITVLVMAANKVAHGS